MCSCIYTNVHAGVCYVPFQIEQSVFSHTVWYFVVTLTNAEAELILVPVHCPCYSSLAGWLWWAMAIPEPCCW